MRPQPVGNGTSSCHTVRLEKTTLSGSCVVLFKNLFLVPLRLAVGWGAYSRSLSLIAVVMLVLLRVTIGWHFYSEGVEKYQSGNWDAKPFFANAKGPFANHFRELVWDHDGQVRLAYQKTKTGIEPSEEVKLHFAIFRDRVKDHYGFAKDQVSKAQQNYARAIEQLRYSYTNHQDTITEFRLGLDRLKKLDSDQRRAGVASLSGQTETVRSELNQKIAPVLQEIDDIWSTYEQAQNRLATVEQATQRKPLRLGVIHRQAMDTKTINQIVPYFDMAIGICLILGLFTPVAALAAAGFLGSVFLSQYPPSTGPNSTMYQLIESMACLVLASVGAGRFAGLDFLIHTLTRKLWVVPEE